MTERLKPCPFCGGEAHLQPFMGYWTVGCTDCFGAVVGKIETKEEAIKEWNKRSNWHTGTPTEEGWYLVAYQHKDKITYRAVRFFLEKGLDMEFLDSEGGIYYPDIWRAVAWRKIEPYEASKERE